MPRWDVVCGGSNKNEALAKFLKRKKEQGQLSSELASKVLQLPQMRDMAPAGEVPAGLSHDP